MKSDGEKNEETQEVWFEKMKELRSSAPTQRSERSTKKKAVRLWLVSDPTGSTLNRRERSLVPFHAVQNIKKKTTLYAERRAFPKGATHVAHPCPY